MTGPEFLERHRVGITEACAQFGVKSLRAFGSVLTSRFDEASDLDLVATFGPHPLGYGKFKQVMGFTLALEDLTQRKVDLYEWETIESPSLRAEVSQAVELYAA